MTSLVDRFRKPLKSRVKRALAGADVDALTSRRDRRRLRWMAQEGGDPLVRFRALRALAELADRDAADVFLAVLHETAGDPETAAVRVAAEGLGRMRHEPAAAALRRLLSPERPAQVQIAAARALATLGAGEDWGAIRRWAIFCCQGCRISARLNWGLSPRAVPSSMTNTLISRETRDGKMI